MVVLLDITQVEDQKVLVLEHLEVKYPDRVAVEKPAVLVVLLLHIMDN